MLSFDKTVLTFCRGVIGFSFKAYKNSFSQSALLGAASISPKLELWTLGSEIYVSGSFSLISGMGVNLIWTSEDEVSHEGFNVALAVVTSQMVPSLCAWDGEDGTGERQSETSTPPPVFWGMHRVSHTFRNPGRTHTSQDALHRFFFWILRLPSSLPFLCLFVCFPLCQLNCSMVTVPFAILSLTLKFWLIYENIQFLKFDSLFKIVLSNVVMEIDCAKE